MAIKYLDAKRIRGNYVAASPASDWTVASDNAEYVLTGNQINFALKRDGENGTAVVDLGAGTISDTWVLRMHVNFTGNSSGDSYAYQSFWGLSDLPLAQNWGDAQDSAGFVIHFAGTGGSGDNRFAVVETDGNSGFEDSSVSYSGLTVTPTGEWWVELKRINSTTITLGVYTDATYGTLVSGTSVTSNTNFSGTGLRYLKLAVPNYSTQSEIQNGTLNEIEFYDNMTTASGTPLKFLTAAEDDKATFFAVDTSATADLTSTFTCSASGTTSNCGGWNFRRNNSNSTTDQMHVTLKRSGSTYLSVYDLVTNGIISSPISTESFVLRFSFTPRSNSWDSGASRNLWVGLTDNGGTGDSDGANNSQDFVGMEINGSTSGTGKYSGIGGSSINLTTVADTTSQISLSGDWDYSTPTTYYFEIIKSGGNVQVKRYTNSNYNTEVSSSATTSVSANSPTGLRYIKFMTWDQSSTDGEMEANVPKVEFWKETTKLPENTLFEETNTYKTYWLQDGGWKPVSPDYETDFSTRTGWTAFADSGGHSNKILIDTSTERLNWLVQNVSNKRWVEWRYCLGTDTNVESKWILRFKFHFTSGDANTPVFVLVSNDKDNGTNEWQRACGLMFQDDGATSFRAIVPNGTGSGTDFCNTNLTTVISNSITPVDGRDYWIELLKSPTQLILNVYSDEYDTLLGTATRSAAENDIKDQRVIKIMNHRCSGSSNTMSGWIDDMKFWNGINTTGDL